LRAFGEVGDEIVRVGADTVLVSIDRLRHQGDRRKQQSSAQHKPLQVSLEHVSLQSV
jgi:hypothetical protein